MILYHMILQIFFHDGGNHYHYNLVCKCPKSCNLSLIGPRQDCEAAPAREISTTGHTPTSCCPCPTCMFTGTAVLPAYLHNPVFPDGVSEGSPHKLPLVLICILSPETGSVGSSAATRQPNHVYLSPSAAPHLAKDQF